MTHPPASARAGARSSGPWAAALAAALSLVGEGAAADEPYKGQCHSDVDGVMRRCRITITEQEIVFDFRKRRLADRKVPVADVAHIAERKHHLGMDDSDIYEEYFAEFTLTLVDEAGDRDLALFVVPRSSAIGPRTALMRATGLTVER